MVLSRHLFAVANVDTGKHLAESTWPTVTAIIAKHEMCSTVSDLEGPGRAGRRKKDKGQDQPAPGGPFTGESQTTGAFTFTAKPPLDGITLDPGRSGTSCSRGVFVDHAPDVPLEALAYSRQRQTPHRAKAVDQLFQCHQQRHAPTLIRIGLKSTGRPRIGSPRFLGQPRTGICHFPHWPGSHSRWKPANSLLLLTRCRLSTKMNSTQESGVRICVCGPRRRLAVENSSVGPEGPILLRMIGIQSMLDLPHRSRVSCQLQAVRRRARDVRIDDDSDVLVKAFPRTVAVCVPTRESSSALLIVCGTSPPWRSMSAAAMPANRTLLCSEKTG